MAFNNAQLHPAAVFNNKGFRNAATYSRYLRRFRDRPIYPSFSIQPSRFSKYDMDIPSLLDGLGWSSLVNNMRFSHCPDAVRLFFVNLKCGPGCDPSFFTTYVFNYEITVTPTLLAALLNCPHSGLQAGTYSEFAAHGFDLLGSLSQHTRDIRQLFPSPLAASRLPDDLKFGLEYFDGPLPFGHKITKLLYLLSIDMCDKVTTCNVLDDLRPQHVLAKLDALVGPRKPVTGSGGVMISPETYQSESLAGALVDAVVSVIKRETSGSRKQTATRKLLRQQDLMWPKFVYESGAVNDPMSSNSEPDEEDDISEYESPPKYQF
ncbi:unnamed protein product [Linum trigynum]|uniref:Uncharacterized protein n=1 Tax=Linum trigynum TaxID=586398 RepID=A0AAV2DEQ3_9ROSI